MPNKVRVFDTWDHTCNISYGVSWKVLWICQISWDGVVSIGSLFTVIVN
jgi:hypothetical protein